MMQQDQQQPQQQLAPAPAPPGAAAFAGAAAPSQLQFAELTAAEAEAILQQVEAAAEQGEWGGDDDVEDEDAEVQPPYVVYLSASDALAATASMGSDLEAAAAMQFVGVSSPAQLALQPPPAPPYVAPAPPAPPADGGWPATVSVAGQPAVVAVAAGVPGTAATAAAAAGVGYAPPPPPLPGLAAAAAAAPAGAAGDLQQQLVQAMAASAAAASGQLAGSTERAAIVSAEMQLPDLEGIAEMLEPVAGGQAPPWPAADQAQGQQQQQLPAAPVQVMASIMGKSAAKGHAKGGVLPADPSVPPSTDAGASLFCAPQFGLQPAEGGGCNCMPGESRQRDTWLSVTTT